MSADPFACDAAIVSLQPWVEKDLEREHPRLLRSIIAPNSFPMTAQQHLARSYRLRAQSFDEEAHYFAKRKYAAHDDEHVKHCRAQAASYMELAAQIESDDGEELP